MVNPALLQQVLDLPVEDRTALLHDLSDSLVAAGPSVEVRQLLDARVADMEANPDDWSPASDVMADLRERFAR